MPSTPPTFTKYKGIPIEDDHGDMFEINYKDLEKIMASYLDIDIVESEHTDKPMFLTQKMITDAAEAVMVRGYSNSIGQFRNAPQCLS